MEKKVVLEELKREKIWHLEKKIVKWQLYPALSEMILNINNLNSLIKEQRLAECTEKCDPTICHLYETQYSKIK